MNERKRMLWVCVGAVMIAALFTFGCGGDGNGNGGLSAEDMARIDQAEKKADDAETARIAAEKRADDAEQKVMDGAQNQRGSIRAKEVAEALEDSAPDGNIGEVEIAIVDDKLEVREPDGRRFDAIDPLAMIEDWDAVSMSRDTRRTRPDGTETVHAYTYMLEGHTRDFEDVYDLVDDDLVIGTIIPTTQKTFDSMSADAFTVDVGDVTVMLPAGATDSTVMADLSNLPLAIDGELVSKDKIAFDRSFDRDGKLLVTEKGTPSLLTSDGQPGSFHGVDGTFYCASSGGCTVSKDSKGEFSFAVTMAPVEIEDIPTTTDNNDYTISLTPASGTSKLLFVPDDDDDPVKVAEDAHLYFGVWLEQPDDADNEHVFDAFMGTDMAFMFDDDDFDGLDGPATYKGGAVGKYVTQDLAANTAKGGYFTADVNLRADFDGSGMDLDGRIRNFEENGESLGNWYVDLEDGGMAEAKIGRATVDGDWAHAAYGQLDADKAKDRHPAAVLGTFQVGDTGDPALLGGAFGALNTKLD